MQASRSLCIWQLHSTSACIIPGSLQLNGPIASQSWVRAVLALVHMRALSHYGACRRMRSGKLLPGPSFAVPLVGGVVDMVLNPFRFWEDQQKMSFPGTSSALEIRSDTCNLGWLLTPCVSLLALSHS